MITHVTLTKEHYLLNLKEIRELSEELEATKQALKDTEALAEARLITILKDRMDS